MVSLTSCSAQEQSYSEVKHGRLSNSTSRHQTMTTFDLTRITFLSPKRSICQKSTDLTHAHRLMQPISSRFITVIRTTQRQRKYFLCSFVVCTVPFLTDFLHICVVNSLLQYYPSANTNLITEFCLLDLSNACTFTLLHAVPPQVWTARKSWNLCNLKDFSFILISHIFLVFS